MLDKIGIPVWRGRSSDDTDVAHKRNACVLDDPF